MARRSAAPALAALLVLLVLAAGCLQGDTDDGATEAPEAAVPVANDANGSNATGAANVTDRSNGTAGANRTNATNDTALLEGNDTHALVTIAVENAGEEAANVTGRLVNGTNVTEALGSERLAPGASLTWRALVPRHESRELFIRYEPKDFRLDHIPVRACVLAPAEGDVEVEVTLDELSVATRVERVNADGDADAGAGPALEDGASGSVGHDSAFGGC